MQRHARFTVPDVKVRQLKERRYGRRIHGKAVASRKKSNMYVQTALIKFFAKCGSMVDARRVFDGIKTPDVVSWTALLLGYAENGNGHEALNLFCRMKARGFVADSVTYVAALKACTSLVLNGDGNAEECLGWGRKIHSEIGSHLNSRVQSTLIDMYAKCRSMVEARRVFDSILLPDVVSWNALIMGYEENGEGHEALAFFAGMNANGCAPDCVTYIAALKACASLAVNGDAKRKQQYLDGGRALHSAIGCHMNHYVQCALIDMYAKCGSMADARRVFDGIWFPDVMSWNALLLGYADNGEGQVTVDLFFAMKAGKCAPNSVSYTAALKACGSIGALDLGRKLHSEMSDFTCPVVTSLVHFYASCGSMVEAQEVFDLHPKARDVPTWTALIAGYGSFGDTVSAFSLFEAMQDKGFRPNAVTFVCLLLCCSHAGLAGKARDYFDAMPVKYGITPTLMHYTCMIDVLGRANQLNEAVAMLQKMPCNPDAVTWRALLGACCKWKNVEIGRLAFKSLVDMDNKDASAYLLMAQIYGSRGMWEEQQRIMYEAGKPSSLWLST